MTDLEALLLALTVIYGWECACWVQRGGLVFLTRWGRRWRVAVPGTLLGNDRGGFLFAYPLPPLGRILTSVQPQLSLSSRGILAFVPPPIEIDWRTPQTGEFVAFADILSINAKGKTVRINGKALVRAGSVQRAQFLEAQLRHLRELPEDQRQGAIRTLLRRGLAVSSVRNRWREFLEKTGPIRLWCNLLFVYLFVAAPVLVWVAGLGRTWLALVAGLFVCTLSIAIRARRAHRFLYPDAEDERFTLLLTMVLSPPTAIRACDALSRPLLVEHDPVAVARVLLPEEKFKAFARDALLALRYPILPEWPPEQSVHLEAERSWRELRLEALEEELRNQGYDPVGLTSAPVPTDESAVSYCPRCRAQFARATGGCADCGGAALVRLVV